jgi:hypothetical protein
MFMLKSTFYRLNQVAYEENVKLRADLAASQSLVASQKATLDWLMLRMTQLEAERAKLLWKYMGVVVPVPEMIQEPEPGTSVNNPLNALPSFGDMGDNQALKDGYAWDDEGKLTLHGVRI